MASRYHDAAHAMQTGVAMSMARGNRDTEPKHLRVGVNSAHVSIAALTKLLVDKGVITMDEYAEANAVEMENEVTRYEQELDPTGKIKLK